MKQYKNSIVLIVGLFFSCLNLFGKLVVQLPLDHEQAYRLPISKHTTLAVHFPKEIEGIDGMGYSSDPTRVKTDYLISFVEGNHYFSISPISDEPPSRNILVVVEGKIYDFVPEYVENRDEAWDVVYLLEEEKQKADIQPPPVVLDTIRKSSMPPKKKFSVASTAKLMGVLDSLKFISILDEEKLADALMDMPQMEVSLRQNDYKDFVIPVTVDGKEEELVYRIALNRVIRSGNIDTLGFYLTIENLSRATLKFEKNSFSVRAGNYIYKQVVSDFIEELPPGAAAPAYFLIVGSGDGRPNYLAPDNAFTVFTELVEAKFIGSQNETN